MTAAPDIYALDAAALGYASSDVVRFSYRGGRVPAEGWDNHRWLRFLRVRCWARRVRSA